MGYRLFRTLSEFTIRSPRQGRESLGKPAILRLVPKKSNFR